VNRNSFGLSSRAEDTRRAGEGILSRTVVNSRFIAASLLLALLLSACAVTSHQALRAAIPIATSTPRPIELPADDRPHQDLTEWWYYTGHLTADSGARYGFEVVVFQIERADAPVVYAAHVAITDHQRRQFHYDQRSWTLAQPATTFDLSDGSWRVRGDGSSDFLKADAAGYALDLRVTPTKPPALHGKDGVISFGPVGDSFYYSSTRLAVQGVVDDHGQRLSVSGEAWKDRQWGNFLIVPGGGWDWYSLQLSDGSDLMLFVLRDVLNQAVPSYGTLVRPNGSTEELALGTTQVNALGTWTSPATGTTYPAGWSLSLPEQGLQLTLSPVLPDQELDTRNSTGETYWEGEITVEGQSHGKPIAGKGYVELTGYAATRR
jgi:predicted secreted hydrolase